MIKEFRELWHIMSSDPTISAELQTLKRLTRRALVCLAISELVYVTRLVPVMFMVNEVSSPDRDVSYILLLSAGTVLLFLVSDELSRHMMIARENLNWHQWSIWWAYGHRQELRQSMPWHIEHGTGEKDSLVAKNIAKFEALIDQIIFQAMPIGVRTLFVVIGVWFVGWEYGLVVVLSLLFYALSLRKTERKCKSQRREHRKQLRALEVFGSQLTNQWRTIKELGIEESMSDENQRMLSEFCADEAVRNKLRLTRYIRQANTLGFSRGALYATIGLVTLWHQPNIGAVVLVISWIEQVYSNMWRLVDLQMYLAQGYVALQELVALMKLEPTVKQAENPVDPAGLEPEIELKSVGYRYEASQDVEALKDITIKIEAYTATALVGRSGSGKTTLVNKLQRQDDPCYGDIYVGGVNLRELELDRYRREYMSVVSQEIELFDGTIASNIRMSKPDASNDDVRWAARLAYADEFIVPLALGYDSPVGDNGIKLSRGQKQRIVIARALLRRPKLLILDEATSALDAVSQKFVQQSIDELMTARICTVIIIAHRFSTIMNADQVVVMNEGRVAEVGTHEELTRMNGLYKRLRNMEGDGLLD